MKRVFAILFLLSISCLAEQEKTTLEIPEGSVGMIGYGSLMSLPSLEQSLGRKYEGPSYQVHLAGYERAWTHLRPFNEPQTNPADNVRYDVYYFQDDVRMPIDGAVELNIYPQKQSRLNAVLYMIPNQDLIKFDKRERTYKRVDVTDKIEEYRFEGGKVYVYIGFPDRQEKSAPAPGRYILFKEYLDQVTGACDRLGKTFRAEFDESTKPPAYPIVPFANVVWEKIR